jgi:hypothetical protein
VERSPAAEHDQADRATDPSGRGRAVDEGHLLVAVADDRSAAVVIGMQRQRRLSRRQPIEPGGRHLLHLLHFRVGRLPLVIVVDDLETSHDRWEFRTSGLWAEAICEQPGRHWSFGLEAFAVAIDHPDELLGRGYGHRTPLGWELDFESDTAVAADLPGRGHAGQLEPGLGSPASPGPDGGYPEGTLGRGWVQKGRMTGVVQLLPEADPEPTDGIDRASLPGWLAAGLLGPDGAGRSGPEPDGIDRPFAGSAIRRHWWSADVPSPHGGDTSNAAAERFAPLAGTLELPALDEPPMELALPLGADSAGAAIWRFGHDGQRWISKVTREPER